VLLFALCAGMAGAQEREPVRAERANLARPAMPVPPDLFPIATEARLGGDAGRTRLVMDLSRTIDIAAFTLADPYRVVIDLPQLTFQFPPRTGETGKGLIKAFRYGLVMQGGSRIVIDASGPVRIDKAFVLERVDDQPARLVLDLVPVDRAGFMRNLALESRPQRAAEPRKSEPAKHGDARPLIVIDPGHGGPDTGTVAASGEMEKTIVLDFAQALQGKLEKSGKYRVTMTRTDDRFVPLGERVRFARSQGAALFISIHADALAARGETDVRGATVIRSPIRPRRRGRAACRDENKAGRDRGRGLSSEPEEVADILIDLTQRDQELFRPFCPRGRRRTENRRQIAQAPAEIRGLQGAEGPGRAFGADRARLRVEQA
jgi:N-acetylmuramoyl-L-alanine amidase